MNDTLSVHARAIMAGGILDDDVIELVKQNAITD